MTGILVALVVFVCLAVALAGASVRVLREYERAVVFRLGRLLAAKGPGIVLLIPAVDRMVRVDADLADDPALGARQSRPRHAREPLRLAYAFCDRRFAS